MRSIFTHVSENSNPAYAIELTAGNHMYCLRTPERPLGDGTVRPGVQLCTLHFQVGPLDHEVNGVTIESLVAVCLDRLEGFQSTGPACEENDHAIHHLKRALAYLHQRTDKRIARGVLGTNIR